MSETRDGAVLVRVLIYRFMLLYRTRESVEILIVEVNEIFIC